MRHTDTATVTFTDTLSATSTTGSLNANPGATVSYSVNTQAPALAEGTLTISVDVTDTAGNTAQFASPSNATKDITRKVPRVIVREVRRCAGAWNRGSARIGAGGAV